MRGSWMRPVILQHSLYSRICVCTHVHDTNIAPCFTGGLLKNRGKGTCENERAYMADVLLECNIEKLNGDDVLYDHHPGYAILRLFERAG